MLDTNRMFTLRQVADHGSITAAAEALGYTTSAISQQIAKLEKEAGQPLLERHARGIVLTEAGHSVVRHTERILIELQAADAELAEIQGLRAGVLAIGTFPTAGSSLLPLVVKEFKTRHPGVDLVVVSGRFARLVDALRRRETELSLLWDYEWNRIDDPTLTCHHSDERPDLASCFEHHDSPTEISPSFGIGELRDESWVVRADDHPVAQTLEKLCQQGGFTPRTSVFAHDYGEVQAMVAVELGVAIAPRLAVLNPRPDVRSIPLATRPPQRRILIAHLAARRLSPAAHEAIAVSAAAARQLEEGFGGDKPVQAVRTSAHYAVHACEDSSCPRLDRRVDELALGQCSRTPVTRIERHQNSCRPRDVGGTGLEYPVDDFDLVRVDRGLGSEAEFTSVLCFCPKALEIGRVRVHRIDRRIEAVGSRGDHKRAATVLQGFACCAASQIRTEV